MDRPRQHAQPHRQSVRGAFALVVATALLSACYSDRWVKLEDAAALAEQPASVAAVFEAQPDRVLRLEAFDPGSTYRFDVSEKDRHFSADEAALRFRQVEMRLRDRTPRGQVLADLAFVDGGGTRVETGPIDLLRLTPRLDTEGEMQYPELLLEEYERFGVIFRREHKEFAIALPDAPSPAIADAADRAFRLGVWNNCLDPTKWEMVLFTEDYGDFADRLASPLYLNQQRTLSHSWFFVNPDLYQALLRAKNPHLSADTALDYDSLSNRAEQVVVDLDPLRTVKRTIGAQVLEVGHQARTPLEPLDAEQHYKWDFGLIVNRAEFGNYSDVLDQPVTLAQFGDRGFYNPADPRSFDYGWLRQLDEVTIESLEVRGSDCYVQLTIRGDGSPYHVVFGNLDMAMLDEQSLYGIPFGINPYPTARRHSPPQDTIHYETDRMPTEIRPYLLLIDSRTGRWVNNQKKGLEKVFVGWDSIDRDTLAIYLVTYERIMPVWKARVRLNDRVVDRIRQRRMLYTY